MLSISIFSIISIYYPAAKIRLIDQTLDQIGIDKNIMILNFGRTASEIKSSVGAIPQDLTIYFRHKKRITNRILHLFLQRVQPTGFQQKFPFKDL